MARSYDAVVLAGGAARRLGGAAKPALAGALPFLTADAVAALVCALAEDVGADTSGRGIAPAPPAGARTPGIEPGSGDTAGPAPTGPNSEAKGEAADGATAAPQGSAG